MHCDRLFPVGAESWKLPGDPWLAHVLHVLIPTLELHVRKTAFPNELHYMYKYMYMYMCMYIYSGSCTMLWTTTTRIIVATSTPGTQPSWGGMTSSVLMGTVDLSPGKLLSRVDMYIIICVLTHVCNTYNRALKHVFYKTENITIPVEWLHTYMYMYMYMKTHVYSTLHS